MIILSRHEFIKILSRLRRTHLDYVWKTTQRLAPEDIIIHKKELLEQFSGEFAEQLDKILRGIL